MNAPTRTRDEAFNLAGKATSFAHEAKSLAHETPGLADRPRNLAHEAESVAHQLPRPARKAKSLAIRQILLKDGVQNSATDGKRLVLATVRLFALCGLLLCLTGGPVLSASAQAMPRSASSGKASAKVTGIYSNMAYNAEEGDVLGIEIFVVNTNRGYYVVFQSGEGEPTVPVVVPAEVSGASIRFVLPPETVGGTFTGTISSAQLTGSFSSNHQVIRLKHKASYWQ